MATAKTGVIGGLLGALGFAQKSAAERLRVLASKEARGLLTEADTKNVAELMTVSGTSAEDYRRIVALHERYLGFQAAAKDVADAGAKLSAARRAANTAEAETRRLMAERAEIQRPLEDEVHRQVQRIETLQQVEDELSAFSYDNREALGLPEIDEDRINVLMRNRAGGTVLAERLRVPGADDRVVSPETFARIQSRRWDIVQNRLRPILDAEHDAAIEQWLKDSPRTGPSPGQIDTTKYPAPRRPEPTWAEAVKRGLHLES